MDRMRPHADLLSDHFLHQRIPVFGKKGCSQGGVCQVPALQILGTGIDVHHLAAVVVDLLVDAVEGNSWLASRRGNRRPLLGQSWRGLAARPTMAMLMMKRVFHVSPPCACGLLGFRLPQILNFPSRSSEDALPVGFN